MRTPEVLRRAWRSLRAPAEEPEEPLATLFERVNESRPQALRPEPEVLEPDTLAAVEELAAEQEARRATHAAPSRRRWAAAAASAALLGGAGALAAVSWTVWGSDLGGGASRDAARVSVELVLAPTGESRGRRKGTLELVVLRNGRATLRVSKLPRAEAGGTYQVWVEVRDSPKPAGHFPGGRRTVVSLTRAVPRGARIMVTLEPTRGVEAPTGETLYTARR
jgi:hypothetical protein